MSIEPPATSGLSSQLRAFVRVSPYMRRPILRFLQCAASGLPTGSRVLDAGAGDAPYRELFNHCSYVTADFAQTDHDFVRNKPDIICDLGHIPLPDDSLDAVVCSEVLEHLPEPLRALHEFRRILHDGGRLFLTVPFMWPVHEQPYDFFRYTPYALHRLLTAAGFSVDCIRPHGGRMWTMAQYVDDFGRILSA